MFKKTISLCFCLLLLTAVIIVYKNLDADKILTIKVGVTAGGKDYDVTKYQAEEYMRLHPDIKVEVVTLPQSSTSVLAYFLQIIESKSSDIDIFPIDSVWLGELAPALAEFDKNKLKNVTSQMFPILVDECIINGKMLAFPLNATPSVLYYRKDLLKKYDLNVPKTWEELTKTAFIVQEQERKSGNPDFVGYVWQGKAYEGLTCNALEWIASNGGGTIVSKNKKITINNENAIEALKLAKHWIGTISPEGVLSMDEESSRAGFQSGNAMFMRNWPYAYVLCQDADSVVKNKFDICSLPAGENGKSSDILGAGMIGVNKYSKHLEISKDFVLFMVSNKMQKYRTINTGAGSVIKSLYFDKDVLNANPAFEKLYNIFPSAIMRPSTVTAPNYSRVSEEFYHAVYDIISGKKDAGSALSGLAREISVTTGFPIEKMICE
jgi:trehalose/maltose transport system substrate-binding protein